MTTGALNHLISFLTGFIPGSIPFGYLAGVINRIDIRQRGSGNIGFTNVARTLGLTWAIPVFILDIAKGMIPVAFARTIGLTPALVGLGAIAGHIFTPWLRFRGGKGVATTIGVTALLCPKSLLVAIAIYVIVLLITGFVSLSSIIFALILPVLTRIFYPDHLSLLVFTIGTGIIIIARHIDNIRRLLNKTEPRFGLWLKLFRKEAK